ncbi:hypothetical protein LQW54_007728 [Pestalotiopsis sp. IQ-011]
MGSEIKNQRATIREVQELALKIEIRKLETALEKNNTTIRQKEYELKELARDKKQRYEKHNTLQMELVELELRNDALQ